jgi:hypothetical protein
MKLGERIGDIFPTTRHWEAGEWFLAPVVLMLVVSVLAGVARCLMFGRGMFDGP